MVFRESAEQRGGLGNGNARNGSDDSEEKRHKEKGRCSAHFYFGDLALWKCSNLGLSTYTSLYLEVFTTPGHSPWELDRITWGSVGVRLYTSVSRGNGVRSKVRSPTVLWCFKRQCTRTRRTTRLKCHSQGQSPDLANTALRRSDGKYPNVPQWSSVFNKNFGKYNYMHIPDWQATPCHPSFISAVIRDTKSKHQIGRDIFSGGKSSKRQIGAR
ncbi:hypothetical protein GGU11DRAFT_880754 [Lentinula aff. detonsa]|nr:hypothetical protein GGU11DRAFT_880754 [Lentinula aff. detonsa]